MNLRTPFWVRTGLALGVLACTACTALLGDFDVDTTSSSSGDPGCPSGKSCSGQCVAKEDPTTGCANASCDPCPARPNAAATCTGGACAFACNQGLLDCDSDPNNGCERRVTEDVRNCGACGNTCGNQKSAQPPRCVAGKCEFTCEPGFAHCGTADGAGCETDLQTNGEHCGACGHSCLGGACVAGKCQPFLLAAADRPSGIALDATNVYYTVPSAPHIGRIGRDGKCNPATPCPQPFAGLAVGDPLSEIRGPSAIVSDGNFVWWTNQANGNLGRRAAGGGAIVNFGPAVSTQPGYVTLAGGQIYWTTGFSNVAVAPHVRRANLDGSNVVAFANYANPANTFAGFGGITSDATHVYWASQNSGVFRAPIGGAECTEGTNCAAFNGASGAFAVAVDDMFVYWCEPTGTVRRQVKVGGGSSIVIASGQDNPRAIAVVGDFVYWGNQGTTPPTSGEIRRAVKGGGAQCIGTACELVTTVAQPEGMVSGSDGLYFTSTITGTGGVYRLAK